MPHPPHLESNRVTYYQAGRTDTWWPRTPQVVRRHQPGMNAWPSHWSRRRDPSGTKVASEGQMAGSRNHQSWTRDTSVTMLLSNIRTALQNETHDPLVMYAWPSGHEIRTRRAHMWSRNDQSWARDPSVTILICIRPANMSAGPISQQRVIRQSRKLVSAWRTCHDRRTTSPERVTRQARY